MARPLRVEFPGAIYHVMSRGNARQTIFLDDFDRRVFVSNFFEVCERLDWWVWTYCVMENHYHALIETAQPTLSRGMHQLNARYSQRFNRRHNRVGHLFQGRYKALLVDRDSYLLEVARYIVLNPVRAGLCRAPAEWPWSSYRAMIGDVQAPDRLARAALLSFFGSAPCEAYVEFVASGVNAKDPALSARRQIFLGDEDFVKKVARWVSTPSREVPRIQRALKSLTEYANESATERDAIFAAYESGTYSIAAIGRHFGLHRATVGRIIKARKVATQDLTPSQCKT